MLEDLGGNSVFNVIFPELTDQRYYDIHYKYVLNILTELGCNIKYEKRDGFVVTIAKKDILFDYSDSTLPVTCQLPIFKFHCIKETPRLFSFPPVSFYQWNDYAKFSEWIKYKAEGNISFRQRPYGNAKERRSQIRAMLVSKYKNVLINEIGQFEYWFEINNTFLAVFVPGFSNNMLDRGQFQYMAFGCCTISPRLPEILPFGNYLIPNEHYIMCRDDYSDLIDLIEFYSCCKETCLEIGQKAKKLFMNTSTPNQVAKWIESKL
jgi:hypothetical protein